MKAIDCIMSRRSTRKFLQKAVEFDKIALILQAGSKAPSVGNLQDYRFLVITDRDKILALSKHCTEQYWISEAPTIILVCTDTEMPESYYGLRGQRLYAIQDAAAAIQNMLLTAHLLGLGACWVGSFDENYVSDVFKLPEKVRPQAIIPIGYAAEEPKERQECEIQDLVFFNEYGNKIENMNILLHEYNKEIAKTAKKVGTVAENLKEKSKSFFSKFKKQEKK